MDDGRWTRVKDRQWTADGGRRVLPGLSVRLAVFNDGDALAALVAAVRTESVAPSLPAHVLPEHTFVAVRDDALVGFVSWSQDEMLGVITGVGVRASHRRFGVASALLNAAAECLRDEGLRLLETTIDRAFPNVRALFEQQGFRAVGAWVSPPDAPSCWVTVWDDRGIGDAGRIRVRYERRLLGRRRNRGDGFYA